MFLRNPMDTDVFNSNIPIIHLRGQNIFKIFNYKKILHYHPNEIHILLVGNILNIKGHHLNIDYFNEDELMVRGSIQMIIFHNS